MTDESVDNGVNELNEELGITETEKDIIEVPEKDADEKSEADLAQQALDESPEETDENTETKEEKVPLAKYMGEKNKRRDLEIENAELRGENKVRAEMGTTTQSAATKSPIQLEMEAQEVDSEDELELTGAEAIKLMRKEQAFESKQAESSVAATTAQTVKDIQTASCNTAKETYNDVGLEFSAILADGEALLTEGEKLDLWKSKEDFGEEAYKKCLNAIIRKGGERAEQIQKLIDAKNLNKEPDKVEPKKEPKKKADLEEMLESDDTDGEGDERPNRHLRQFMKVD